jgi:TIR domain
MNKYQYDFALSFAGEDRNKAKVLSDILKSRNLRVFYDEDEQAGLWGKDLYQRLQEIYRYSSRYCVIFVSSSYKDKLWPRHELKQAQARNFSSSSGEGYILPIRVDETEIPGINQTVGYISWLNHSPEQIVDLLESKLNDISEDLSGNLSTSYPTAHYLGGLRPYESEEKDYFLAIPGVKEQLSELRSRVEKNFITLVVGRARIGKSSLIKAGLVPTLHEQVGSSARRKWQCIYTHPIHAQASLIRIKDFEPICPGLQGGETLDAILASIIDSHKSDKVIAQPLSLDRLRKLAKV